MDRDPPSSPLPSGLVQPEHTPLKGQPNGYEHVRMRRLFKLLGFAAAAFFALRWLKSRIGSDATVDAAPPTPLVTPDGEPFPLEPSAPPGASTSSA
jgi:hypothetical protein